MNNEHRGNKGKKTGEHNINDTNLHRLVQVNLHRLVHGFPVNVDIYMAIQHAANTDT